MSNQVKSVKNGKQQQQQQQFKEVTDILLNPDEVAKENIDLLIKGLNAKRGSSNNSGAKVNGNKSFNSNGLSPSTSKNMFDPKNDASSFPFQSQNDSSSSSSINQSSNTHDDTSPVNQEGETLFPKFVILNRVSDGGSRVEYDVDEIPKFSFTMGNNQENGEVRSSVNSNATTFSFIKPFTPTRISNRLKGFGRSSSSSSSSSSPPMTPLEQSRGTISFIAGNKGRRDLRSLSSSSPSLVRGTMVSNGSKKSSQKANNKKLIVQGITLEQLESPLFQVKNNTEIQNEEQMVYDDEDEEFDEGEQFDNEINFKAKNEKDADNHALNSSKDIGGDITLNISNGAVPPNAQENSHIVFDTGNITAIPVESPVAQPPKGNTSKPSSPATKIENSSSLLKKNPSIQALSTFTLSGSENSKETNQANNMKGAEARTSISQKDQSATPKQTPIKIQTAQASPKLQPQNISRSQSQNPEKSQGSNKAASKPKAKSPDHSLAKFGILLSRSSGLDKFASFFQYAALFWGHQPWFVVPKGKNATWRNLEESMSAGKKVMRLFKWIKEMERVQRAALTRDIGPHHTEARAKLAQVLAVMMHSSSFLYYFFDNLVYSSQIGLMNRPKLDIESITSTQNKLVERFLSSPPKEKSSSLDASTDEEVRIPLHVSEKYSLLEQQRIIAIEQGDKCRKFESLLKDGKNYSSLSRLFVALLYSSLQLYSIQQETKLLSTKYIAKIMEARIITGLGAEYDLSMESEEEVVKDLSTGESEADAKISKQEEDLRKERREKIEALNDFASENIQEIIMSLCNLGILLQRMNISIFGKLPTWFCGVLGVICAILGMKKNWPVEQLPPKKYKPTVIVPVLTNTNI